MFSNCILESLCFKTILKFFFFSPVPPISCHLKYPPDGPKWELFVFREIRDIFLIPLYCTVYSTKRRSRQQKPYRARDLSSYITIRIFPFGVTLHSILNIIGFMKIILTLLPNLLNLKYIN